MKDRGIGLPVNRVSAEESEGLFERGGCSIRWQSGGFPSQLDGLCFNGVEMGVRNGVRQAVGDTCATG